MIAISVLALLAAVDTEAAPRPGHLLVAGGDTMIARSFSGALAAHHADWPFGEVGKIMRGADLALVNLECVVASRGAMTDKGELKPFLYRAPPVALEALVAAGVDLVTTANNHTMDYGPAALEEQLELLAAAGIAQAGAGRDRTDASAPTYVKVGELILAVIGVDDQATHGHAAVGRPGTNSYPNDDAIARSLVPIIREARARAHLVVVSPHWGRNWTEGPTAARVKLAHALIDAGADAILGHSAHQFHGVEVYRGRAIVYDMGTFLFDWIHRAGMEQSVAVLLSFGAGGFTELRLLPVRLRSSRVGIPSRVWAERTCAAINEKSAGFATQLRYEPARRSCVVTLAPGARPAPRQPPEEIEESGRTRSLPLPMQERRPGVVLDVPPTWTDGFVPVRLTKGVTVLGARIPEATAPGTGFLVEVALSAGGPLRHGWHGIIVARRERDGAEITLRHPIADGAWTPDRWQSGQVVIDRTLARPPRFLRQGTWKLFWGMENHRSRKRLRLTARAGESLVPIGEIEVYWLAAPYRPSGLGWDGARASLRWWLWLLIGLGLAGLLALGHRLARVRLD